MNDDNKEMKDFSFTLHLENESFEKGTFLIAIPGIDEVVTQKNGRLFIKKYFIHNTSNPRTWMIRITSQDESFKKIYSIDICNRRLEPIYGGMVKNDTMNKQVIIKMISYIGLSKKLGNWADAVNKLKSLLVKKESNDIDKTEKRVLLFYQALMVGLTLLSVLIAFKFYFKQYINWKELTDSYKAEQEVNKALFVSQQAEEPAFSLYHKLIIALTSVINSKSTSLILYGPPGMSKTYMVRRTLFFANLKPGRDYIFEKGSAATIRDVYKMLFEARRKILILDDFDTPLKNQDMINFLKSITDSYSRRIISLPTSTEVSSQQDIGQDVPRRFEFRGRLIIITNLRREELDRALLSRCSAMEVSFNAKEIIKALETLLVFMNPEVELKDKLIVFNYIKEQYRKKPTIYIDFRTFKNSIDAYIGDPQNWKEICNLILGIA